MSGTYCGKNCADCTQKNQLKCPGCKNGPGKPYNSSCDIAKCAQAYGKETCISCAQKDYCASWRDRAKMADYRRKKAAEEVNRKKAIAQRARILNKGLPLLFVAYLIPLFSGIMVSNVVLELAPFLLWPGYILSALSGIIAFGVLQYLSSIDDRYHTAAVCELGLCVLNIITAALSHVDSETGTLLSLIATVTLGLIRKKNLYMAHSAVLCDVDDRLAEDWESLWRWYWILYACAVGGPVIMVISAILGALGLIVATIVTIGAIIGVFLVGIIELVNLRKMIVAFSWCPVEELE